MKKIDTLVSDIGEVLKDENHFDPDIERLKLLGTNIGIHTTATLAERGKEREPLKLWASDIGERCARKQWYKFNRPNDGEPLPPSAKFKFLYGNSIEELVLFLAKEAGHSVSNEQERIEYEPLGTTWRVTGRIDAVVDDVLVDVKSTSSYGFKKYKNEGLNEDNDTFGYIWQLSFYYHYGSTGCGNCGFLWVDKQNGHILYTPVIPKSKDEVDERIRQHIESVTEDSPPERAYAPVPFGKSGNTQLSVPCSYCPFKVLCWPSAQGYAYSHGPVWLVDIKREPNVPRLG